MSPKYTCDLAFNQYIDAAYFREFAPLSPVRRCVRRFEIMTEILPVHFTEEDRFAGFFGFEHTPEATGDGPYLPVVSLSEEIDRKQRLLANRYRSFVSFDRGHNTADYGRILSDGLEGYEKLIDSVIEKTGGNEMLLAMKDEMALLYRFTERIAAEAEKAAGKAETQEARDRLQAIAARIRRVPRHPAEDLTDAIQAIWLIHFLIPLASASWFSISLGRLDRYLLPYYRRSVENGMEEKEIKAVLKQFWTLLNTYADGACAMNVGGGDQPYEEYNELSRLLIECQKEFAMPGPILAARITRNTPEEILSLLIDERLFRMGQPTFYLEENCREALKEKGLSEKELDDFIAESCMGIGVAGDELDSMWGCVLETTEIFRAALEEEISKGNGGAEKDGYESLVRCFQEKAEEAFALGRDSYIGIARFNEINHPDVFHSMLTRNAVEKGRDRVSGVTYHNVTVECFGLANTADGLTAIRKLVFQEKKYTLARLKEAADADFIGYEELRADLLACPKYGKNDPDADGTMARLMEILSGIIRKGDVDNFRFLPSLHTLHANVGNGTLCQASFDGRKNGAPLAKNAGPSNDVRQSNPLPLVLSAGSLPQKRFYGGQPIDLHFDARTVREHPAEIAAVLRAYGALGGLQIQVNSLSSELLKKAAEDPEAYPDLTVKIGGFSMYFRDLDDRTKAEFIERFEKEETEA